MEAGMKVEKIIIRAVNGEEYEYQNAIISEDVKSGVLGVKVGEFIAIFIRKNIIMIELYGIMEVNDEETN